MAEAGDALGVPAAAQLHAWSGLVGAEAREFPSGDSNTPEIAGYTDQLSYETGESVQLFVHTTAPVYEIEVVRDGLQPKSVWARTSAPGVRQTTPEDAAALGCGWHDPVVIRIGEDWASGAYVVLLRAAGSDGERCEREAFFIVRPASGARVGRIALVVTTATATAYNDWGGANAYRSVVDGRSTDSAAPLGKRIRPSARRRPALRGYTRHAAARAAALNKSGVGPAQRLLPSLLRCGLGDV